MRITLRQAIGLALKQNRDVQLAELSVTDKQHKKESARSDYFPQMKNSSNVLHITELEGVEIPEGAFGHPAATGPIPAKSLSLLQGAYTQYVSSTSLEQATTKLFKIHESNRAAAADVRIAKITADQTQEEIALAVRNAFYNVLIDQSKQEAALEEVRANRILAKENAAQVQQGASLTISPLETQASLLGAQQSALTASRESRELMLQLDDLLGLPLTTRLQLDPDLSETSVQIPSRAESLRLARKQSPAIRSAEEAVVKAKASLGIAKDAYIPELTPLARYSYQSGVPFLVHNFGTFGATFTYDLFDGGRRRAEVRDARTLLSIAQLSLAKSEEEAAIQVETSYDNVEQLQSALEVAAEVLKLSEENARVTDRQFEQGAAVASAVAQAHAKAASARASSLQSELQLSLSKADLIRTIGEIGR